MNFCGIFATHQHGLLSEDLGLLPMLDRCYVQRMLTQLVPPPPRMRDGKPSVCKVWLQPTFQLAPGTSTESMALQVANREGLTSKVIQDAERFMALLPK
jgi:DNA mismatch repair ATPase MutS